MWLMFLEEVDSWVLTTVEVHGEKCQVADIVLIMDNCVPRENWCLEQVIGTLPDKQGLVWQVKSQQKLAFCADQ